MSNQPADTPPPDDEQVTVITGSGTEAVTVPASAPIPAQRPAEPEQTGAQQGARRPAAETVPLDSLLTSPVVRPAEQLRFGPGVPAVAAAAPVLDAARPQPNETQHRRRRRERVLNGTLTAALTAIVIWLLWPASALRVESLSVRAPATVGCGGTAHIVATIKTNGKAGRLHYRWERNDGQASGDLQQSVARGQHSTELQLRWVFHGPGNYAADATVHLLKPVDDSTAVHFAYHC